MNKHSLLAYLLLCFVIQVSFAQDNPILTVKNVHIGKTDADNAVLNARVLYFEEYIDGLEGGLENTDPFYVILRKKNKEGVAKKGKAVCLDLKENKYLWTTKLRNLYSTVECKDTFHFLETEYTSSLINPQNGKPNWKLEGNVVALYPSQNLGVFIRNIRGNNMVSFLEGVDLKTSIINWSYKIERGKGKINFSKLKEGNLLIESDGIHMINVLTGKGWSKQFPIVEYGFDPNNKREVSFCNSISPLYNRVVGINSNVMFSDSTVTQAGRDGLYRIDRKTGNEIWKATLNENESSESIVLGMDSSLLLINLGKAEQHGKRVYHGKPFIHNYDVKTGEMRYSIENAPEKDILLDLSKKGDTLYFLYSSFAISRLISTGQILDSLFPSLPPETKLNAIKKDAFYTSSDSVHLISLHDTTMKQLIVRRSDDQLEILTNKLQLVGSIPKGAYYKSLYNGDHFRVFERNDKFFLTDRNMKIRAKFEKADGFYFRKNQIMVRKNNGLLVIDVDKL